MAWDGRIPTRIDYWIKTVLRSMIACAVFSLLLLRPCLAQNSIEHGGNSQNRYVVVDSQTVMPGSLLPASQPLSNAPIASPPLGARPSLPSPSAAQFAPVALPQGMRAGSVTNSGVPANTVSREHPSLPGQHPFASYRAVVEQALTPTDPNVWNAHKRMQHAMTGRLVSSAIDEDLLNMGPTTSGTNEDPLASIGPMSSPHGKMTPEEKAKQAEKLPPGLNQIDPHAQVYAENLYPSAIQCAQCHKKIYDEWRISAHAYSGISPMFHKFEQKIAELSRGTVGMFCVRCHAPIATQMNLERYQSIIDAPHVFREGVTCIVCHRVKEISTRSNGERRVEPGNIYDAVYGSYGGDGVQEAISKKDQLKIKVDPNDKGPGQSMHREAIQFHQLSDSSFCAPCHQVAVHPGIALEVVYAQYRAGPACKKGISCQDCHMGAVVGKPLGYAYGAAAEVDGKVLRTDRKHSNHMFYGPGNSIAHPGIFPHNEKSLAWSFDQWQLFDWRAGWGTDEFERSIANLPIKPAFPSPWDSVDERREARKVLDENLALLSVKDAAAVAAMESGSHIDGPFFKSSLRRGEKLQFEYVVHNTSEGHNMPSGSLGAQPQLWLNVVLTGPSGEHLWESGYLDANGDLANQHSLLVAQRAIKPDLQLFNLQTQFLITGVKGTDREMYLPVNVDFDPLPFLRPGAVPITVLNHPPFIRMEAHSIPPLENRTAKYSVPAELIRVPGTYRLSVRLRSRMEPIYFMRFCEATSEMERRMIEGTRNLHTYSVEFQIQ